LFGVVESMRADVTAFLHAICFAAPAMTTYFALRGLSEGLSMPRPSMYFSFGGLLILAPLGYVLMYGKLGFPGHGRARQRYRHGDRAVAGDDRLRHLRLQPS
jgi:MATE family multidrug resistance protein